MKFPVSMLRDFVQTDLDAEQIGDLLTMTGFELEEITEVEGEPVLDVNIMSNRGDGLSVFGLAREVLAKDPDAKPTEHYKKAVAGFVEGERPGDDAERMTSVSIETPDCTRYACMLFQGVQNTQAPDWMQKRLRQAGQRPISLLVDLTNYVLIELGQPLHAFDLDTLAEKRIVVRQAKAGEKLTTLDEQEHELNPEQMMICDAEKPVAAAGIMGGLDTEVTDGTKNMLLESAHFECTSIRRTRNQLGLNTEASYRFERSVDPEGVVRGLNRFALLLAEVDGGNTRVPGVIDHYPGKAEREPIAVDLDRADMLLGMPVTKDEAQGYLERLGFQLSEEGNGFTVVPPTWRPDIVREEDLVEELGRVHGYEKIPEVLPGGASLQGGTKGFEAFTDLLREAVVRVGYSQIISHSLRDKHPLDDPRTGRIGPRNPASPDMALLRNSLWPSLADSARRNGGRDLQLFEIGRVFQLEEDTGSRNELINVGLLSSGALQPLHWVKEDTPQADFFSLKGAVEQIATEMMVDLKFALPSEDDEVDARLHPTKQAVLSVGGQKVGCLGVIHPDIAEDVLLPEDTVLAELSAGALYSYRNDVEMLKPISRNPAVRRDIAILVDKEVPFEKISSILADACGDVLEKQWLFDVYEGKGIPEGKHSLAIALQLRKLGENFTDEEANDVREKAVAALSEVNATLR